MLGHSWLTRFNPLIDWVLGCITFHSPLQTDSLTSPETVASGPISSKTPSPPTLLVALKVSFVNAAAFAHLSKMGDTQVYQLFLSDKSAPDNALVNMMGVPSDHHNFTDIFSKTCTCTPAPHQPYDHKIELEEKTSPPFSLIDSLSQSELKFLREFLDEHLTMDFIYPSWSQGGALVLFMHKKDGLFQLCVDFCSLNKITKKDRYPLPHITNLLNSLCKDKIYLKINHWHAYHLVQIREGDEWKMAFWTRYGSFEWHIMPFGLTNAPATFQRFMNDVFGDLLDVCILVYLDNILIYTWDFSDKCHSAFKTLKKAFTAAPILAHWIPGSTLIVEMDTSDYALAAILSTVSPTDGEIHPIISHSWTFTPPELNYNIHDKELLTIFKAFKTWRHYLEGSPTLVNMVTDHKNLEYFSTTKLLTHQQV